MEQLKAQPYFGSKGYQWNKVAISLVRQYLDKSSFDYRGDPYDTAASESHRKLSRAIGYVSDLLEWAESVDGNIDIGNTIPHTPGPWNRNIKPATHYASVWAGRCKHVAYMATSGLTSEEVEGNITLISMAPAMWQFIRKLVEAGNEEAIAFIGKNK